MNIVLRSLGVLVALIVSVCIWSYWRMDGFRATPPPYLGECAVLEGPGSAEDIAIDPEHKLAYISVYDRLAMVAGREPGQGGVAVLALSADADSYAIDPTPELQDFRPHGLSLFRDNAGELNIFVINHRSDGRDSVERFVADDRGGVQWRETFHSALFTHANDLVAVGSRQFFLGTDSGAESGWQRGLEMLGLIGLSDIVFFDSKTATVLVDDFPSAGGIEASRDGQALYVSATASRELVIYQISDTRDALAEYQRIPLPLSPDNIAVDAEDMVWLAGHPKVMGLVRHFASRGETPAPSMALRIDPRTGKVETVFSDDGQRLSASSVAVLWQEGSVQELLLGGITPSRMLRCRL